MNDECQKLTSSRSTIGLSSIGNVGVEALGMYQETKEPLLHKGLTKLKKNFAIVCESVDAKAHQRSML